MTWAPVPVKLQVCVGVGKDTVLWPDSISKGHRVEKKGGEFVGEEKGYISRDCRWAVEVALDILIPGMVASIPLVNCSPPGKVFVPCITRLAKTDP